jgi:hypothetical protein
MTLSVLVDSSAWVRAFAGREPHASTIRALSEHPTHRVLGHEYVYGELLIGDKGARVKPLSIYVKLAYAPTVAHGEVVAFVRARRLYGAGIGWIDAHLLASALASGAVLYTADVDLHKAARALGVAYSP